MLRQSLLFAVIVIVCCAFPTSKIVTHTVSLSTLTANTSVNYTVPFNGVFTVQPNVGLTFASLSSSALGHYGWKSAITEITTSNAVVTLTPLDAFDLIKLNCIATQGDRLQIFFFTAELIDFWYQDIPFDHENLVKFDPANPPTNVVVLPILASCEKIQVFSSRETTVFTLAFGVKFNGDSTPSTISPRSYASLTAIGGPFQNPGMLSIKTTADIVNASFSLILQKFDDSTQTSAYLIEDYNLVGSLTGTITQAGATSQVVADAGKFISVVYGLQKCEQSFPLNVGTVTFDIQSTSQPNVKFAIMGDFTDYSTYVKVIWNVMDCDSNCTTCYGPSSTECLTCPSGNDAVDGVCVTCDAVCATCTTASFCTSCAALQHRVLTPTTDGKCPCLSGFYEDTTGACTLCPSLCSQCVLSGTVPICTACAPLPNRVTTPVGGLCPCLPGFYEDASGACVSCPTVSQHCGGCSSSKMRFVCTSCETAWHRELKAGRCQCIAGYRESPGSDYCLPIGH